MISKLHIKAHFLLAMLLISVAFVSAVLSFGYQLNSSTTDVGAFDFFESVQTDIDPDTLTDKLPLHLDTSILPTTAWLVLGLEYHALPVTTIFDGIYQANLDSSHPRAPPIITL